jgi:hypothetical protein
MRDSERLRLIFTGSMDRFRKQVFGPSDVKEKLQERFNFTQALLSNSLTISRNFSLTSGSRLGR